jgi:putative YhdH/YhfP family quinone oxidoreductase
MNTPGGFGQYIRVPAEWVVRQPSTLSAREAMIYGTAGFTAAQSVMRLQGHGLRPGDGEILVTGATGGVGSLAVALLATAGYRVVAATGKPDQEAFLRSLGAREIIGRHDIGGGATGPLLRCRWAGVVDTVGGDILAAAIRTTNYRGAVTTCGNVASPEINLTVYPFILRGVSLLGIDSANCPMESRQEVWQRLAGAWKLAGLEGLAQETGLDGLEDNIRLMLQGGQCGRVLVRLSE